MLLVNKTSQVSRKGQVPAPGGLGCSACSTCSCPPAHGSLLGRAHAVALAAGCRDRPLTGAATEAAVEDEHGADHGVALEQLIMHLARPDGRPGGRFEGGVGQGGCGGAGWGGVLR